MTDPTIEHDLQIEISLEIKFYIFFELFCYFIDWWKTLILDDAEIIRSINFITI
jgi:hypothetical protein